MAVNKVIYGNETLMDITDTTANTDNVVEGNVFYAASGTRSTGTLGDATISTHGLMSAADKAAIETFKNLHLSVDSEGYICQTVEVS